MPSSRPRLSVTKDPLLAEALDRGRALSGSAAEATLAQVMLAGQMWITPVVKLLELLYSTRDQKEFGRLQRRLDAM